MKTILVVEDDPDVLAYVEDALAEQGYRVVTAPDGRQGLAALALVHADLIICDIRMPALDGRKMCHIVRANPAYQDVPIVLMSGGNEAVRRQFANARYLDKPFATSRLLDTVGALLGAA
ncbi:MAG TPA: response regulator [Herpetosiphonaceae bacterium]